MPPGTPPAPRLLTRFGDHFYAIDKPAGWLTHPAGTDAPDVVAWIKAQGGLPSNLRPVHRLDAETSGVVLCATRAGRKAASTWFEERSVDKIYLALVQGRTSDRGVIRRPLKPPRGPAKPAVTRYRTVERLGGFTLVEVRPETGRKHQIRRHFAGIGHALVGDVRHGGRLRPVPAFPGRLWLHAASLRVPVREEPIASPTPAALEATLAALRAG